MPRPSNPEDAMRGFLTGEDPGLARFRAVMRHLPHGPNCKLCAAPFEGPGGAVLRHIGFGRFPGNPSICGNCIRDLNKVGVYGAEIPVSLLFADIRGSTGIGERLSPTEFRAFLDRFYRLSSRAILGNDGIVDKFVGDEAIGLFFRGISGAGHTAAAIRAARALLAGVGQADATQHAGRSRLALRCTPVPAFVGSTGAEGAVSDFTALGDVVNTTARLAAEAGPGELLISIDAVRAAELDAAGLEHRTVAVRGRSDPIEVVADRAEARGDGERIDRRCRPETPRCAPSPAEDSAVRFGPRWDVLTRSQVAGGMIGTSAGADARSGARRRERSDAAHDVDQPDQDDRHPGDRQDRSLAFYADVLGFEKTLDAPFGRASAGSRSARPVVARPLRDPAPRRVDTRHRHRHPVRASDADGGPRGASVPPVRTSTPRSSASRASRRCSRSATRTETACTSSSGCDPAVTARIARVVATRPVRTRAGRCRPRTCASRSAAGGAARRAPRTSPCPCRARSG